MQLISRNLSMYQLAHKPLPGSSSKRRPQHYLVVHRAPLKPSQTIALHVNMRNKQSVKHFISLASVRKLAAPTAGLKFLRYHNGKLTMSGRRRHVHLGLRESVEAPKEGQSIVRVVNARGGNIVEVRDFSLVVHEQPPGMHEYNSHASKMFQAPPPFTDEPLLYPRNLLD